MKFLVEVIISRKKSSFSYRGPIKYLILNKEKLAEKEQIYRIPDCSRIEAVLDGSNSR